MELTNKRNGDGMEVVLRSDGTSFVTKNGMQIGELQGGWFLEFVAYLRRNGVYNIGKIKFTMPNGRRAEYLKNQKTWRMI
jgi:hypothetical protein